MRRWFARLVCWMIRYQLHGRMIALQRGGVDFDAGQITGVYPVEDAEGMRFVCVIGCLHPVSTRLGFEIKQRDVEYPKIRWDRGRDQFVVPDYDS